MFMIQFEAALKILDIHLGVGRGRGVGVFFEIISSTCFVFAACKKCKTFRLT